MPALPHSLITIPFLLTLFAAPPPPSTFTAAPCPFLVPGGEEVTCGFVTVPVDYAQPTGPTLQIGVAVVHSPNPNPRADPLLMLNGGPGLSLLANLPQYWGTFRPLLETRDLIFYDQRGAGWSQPQLNCPELNFPLPTPAETRAAYLACRDRWQAQGVPLSAYTTAANTADAQAVWQALGYSQVNLFGVSYGTILAQHVMRAYPTAVRSVVIDSVYPLGSDLLADTETGSADLYQVFFTACAADALCHAAYPDPAGVFDELFVRYQTQPLTLTVEHPTTHQPYNFRFDNIAFFAALARTSGTAHDFPALLYDLRDGDYHTIRAYMRDELRRQAEGKAGENKAAAISVRCSDATLRGDPARLMTIPTDPKAAVWKQMYLSTVAFELQVCPDWPSPLEPTPQPLQSPIPTLIINGAFELGASPASLDQLHRNLPTSFVYTVPGVGHGAVFQGGDCTTALLLAFYNTPTQAPDAACFASLPNRPLNTRFTLRAALAQLPIQIALGLLLGVLLFLSRQLPITNYRFFPNLNSLTSNLFFPALALGLLLAAVFAITQKWLNLPLAALGAWFIPIFAAVQCALAFSPEDDPALELLLTTGRAPGWILLDRAGLALLLHAGVALSVSGLLSALTGEAWFSNVLRWLPAWLFLPALALLLTITLRRAQSALLITALVWFTLVLFGDGMVERWPILWPLHFYLDPAHSQFGLNCLWFLTLGLTLLLLALHRTRNTEQLLFGASRPLAKSGPIPNPQSLIPNNPFPFPQSPLLGLCLTELRLHFRRPTFGILLCLLLLTPGLTAIVVVGQFAPLRAALQAGAVTLPYATGRVTTVLIPSVWMLTMGLLLYFLPIGLADLTARDHAWGVRELLASTGLSVGRYLAGKVLSVWFLLSVGLWLAFGATWLLWGGFVGPIRVDVLLEVWLLGLWPFALIHAGLSVLLTATQASPRRALLVSLGLVALCLTLQFVGLFTATHWLNLFNPTRPALLLHYLFDWPGAATLATANNLALIRYFGQAASFATAMLSHLAGAATLGLVWVGVWAWLKREG